MAKMIRCLCGKVYDATTMSQCPACGAGAPGSPAGVSPPAFAPPIFTPPPIPSYPAQTRPAASYGASLKQWALTGRSLDGRSIRLELTDLLFSANGGKIIVGRTPEICHLVIADSSVSKQHAHIRREGGRFSLVDRNSANGTAVNGQFNHRPFEELPFQSGDTLTFGEVKLDFSEA